MHMQTLDFGLYHRDNVYDDYDDYDYDSDPLSYTVGQAKPRDTHGPARHAAWENPTVGKRLRDRSLHTMCIIYFCLPS